MHVPDPPKYLNKMFSNIWNFDVESLFAIDFGTFAEYTKYLFSVCI